MAKKGGHFSLGLWVIIIFVLFFGTVIFIGGQQWGESWRTYTVRYPVTYSLPDEVKPGAQVFCGGALVGRVDKVELRRAAREGEQSEVLWAYMDIEVNDLIELRRDCRVVARGPLLGGGGKLVILDPGADGPPLASGTVVDGAATGSLDQALDRLNAELNPQNPEGMLAVIKSQLDPDDAQSLLAKVHGSLDDLNAITGHIARQLDPQQRDVLMSKLHAVLDNVKTTTTYLREQMATGSDDTLGG